MKPATFKSGQTILTEGEDGNTAYLIVEGSVEVSIGEGDAATIIGTLETGDVFGEMSLIEPGPRSATVKAVTDIECLATTYDEFIATIQDNPERAVEFMKTLVRRLRQMNERMISMDPGKRGLREFFRDMQKSFASGTNTPHDVDLMFWPMI